MCAFARFRRFRGGISSRSCKFRFETAWVSAGRTVVTNWAGSAGVLPPTISFTPTPMILHADTDALPHAGAALVNEIIRPVLAETERSEERRVGKEGRA